MTGQTEIAFNVPEYSGAEIAHVRKSLASGHTSSNHEFSQKAREILQAETGAAEVLLTTSCTAALELSAMLLDLEPGDTVIVPSFTFTSTALAFVREGARHPVLRHRAAHARPGPAQRRGPARRLGARGGGGALRRHRLRHGRAARGPGRTGRTSSLIEDNAHGLFGRWRGEPLGSLGRFATLSFHDTKNIICGEGGALVVNDTARRRPGLGALRQGHRPAGVLPGPGGQVLLARHRVVLRPRRHARRDL